MKVCSKCSSEKHLDMFYKKSNNRDGFSTVCKDCTSVIQKLYYENNKEKILAKKKIYNKKYNKLYYYNNKDKQKIRVRAWQIENKDRHLSNRRKREKQKRDSEPSYRLKTNISNTINKMLKSVGGSKRGESILFRLMYTPQQLKEHLEKQFDENMSWDNYGSYWHIDHIYPQSKLIYDSIDHPNFKKCWALENLRSLEAKENNKKGNKT